MPLISLREVASQMGDEAARLASPVYHLPILPATVPATEAECESALRTIPKTDYHCHLNGSISAPLLAHLERLANGVDNSPAQPSATSSDILFFDSAAKRQRNILELSPTAAPDKAPEVEATSASGGRNGEGVDTASATAEARMKFCFTVFDNIYKLMTNLSFTRLAVQDMLLCSAAERVLAMEIRTSLRDGMTQLPTRVHHQGGEDACGSHNGVAEGAMPPPPPPPLEAKVVSKQAYVDTIIETVEHLLGSPDGVVDFATGALLSERTAAWQESFMRLYGDLLEGGGGRHEPSGAGESNLVAEPPSPSHWEATSTSILRFMKSRMHVRLLISVNRGAPVEAGHEAAAIAEHTQRRQVREFHRRCAAMLLPADTAATSGTNDAREGGGTDDHVRPHTVAEMLRSTCWVTGMDLSGNCYKGDLAEIQTVFTAVRAKGESACGEPASEQCNGGAQGSTLPTRGDGSGPAESLYPAGHTPMPPALCFTYHGGEKPCAVELSAMVASGPERWGHLVFTDPTNLHHILASHDPIELCMTSNLLTGGHVDVGAHHLTTLLTAWGLGGVAPRTGLLRTVTDLDVYRRSAQLRMARRTRRGAGPPPSTALPVDAVPNLSFHTDDRGVFGTSVSHELALAARHPLMRGDGTMALAEGGDLPGPWASTVGGLLALERLSLLGVFPVHWMVTLLAVCTEELAAEESRANPACEGWRQSLPAVDCALRALHAGRGGGGGCSSKSSGGRGPLLPSWDACEDFAWHAMKATHSGEEHSLGPPLHALRAELDELEAAWLTYLFDQAC